MSRPPKSVYQNIRNQAYPTPKNRVIYIRGVQDSKRLNASRTKKADLWSVIRSFTYWPTEPTPVMIYATTNAVGKFSDIRNPSESESTRNMPASSLQVAVCCVGSFKLSALPWQPATDWWLRFGWKMCNPQSLTSYLYCHEHLIKRLLPSTSRITWFVVFFSNFLIDSIEAKNASAFGTSLGSRSFLAMHRTRRPWWFSRPSAVVRHCLGWIGWIWMNDDECLSSLMSLIIHSFSEVEKNVFRHVPTILVLGTHASHAALGCLDGHIEESFDSADFKKWCTHGTNEMKS